MPELTTDRETLRLSEVLSALSFMLDMVEGQPEGHTLRSCFIGMMISERLGLPEEQRSALFYALLLKDAGCSANASRVTNLFGADDFQVKRDFKTVNWSRLPNAAMYVARNVSPGGAIWSKARRFFAVGMEGQKVAREIVQIRCERGAEIARLLNFPEETAQAIRNLDEHWDGAGHPDGLKKDEIPLLARICGLAQTMEVFYSTFGPERAEDVARSRRKKWFDPALVDAFLAEAREGRIWESLDRRDLTLAVSCLEPTDRIQTATPELLDLTALAFARIIDAKSPFTYEHSEGVARIAVTITEYMGSPASEVQDQRRAGLLHDVGKLGVSNSILDKPGKLTDAEFAQVKKHPGLTYSTLVRVAPFRSIADLAASHHERLDGSGYHQGVTGKNLDLPARILAVADVYDALTQDRPYRPPMPMEKVLAILNAESANKKLCAGCVGALDELVSKDKL